MRTELSALLVDLAPRREAEQLIPAAVGEDGALPADETVQTAAARDQLVAGAQVQVIGVAEDDLRAGLFEVALAHRLDASLRADRHERRRLHDAVRRAQLAKARGAVGRAKLETEPGGHATIRQGQAEAGPYR